MNDTQRGTVVAIKKKMVEFNEITSQSGFSYSTDYKKSLDVVYDSLELLLKNPVTQPSDVMPVMTAAVQEVEQMLHAESAAPAGELYTERQVGEHERRDRMRAAETASLLKIVGDIKTHMAHLQPQSFSQLPQGEGHSLS